VTSPAVDQLLIEQEHVIILHELMVVSIALAQQLNKSSNAFHLVQMEELTVAMVNGVLGQDALGSAVQLAEQRFAEPEDVTLHFQ